MRHLILILSALFLCFTADAHTISWYAGNQLLDTTTCQSGDNITPPAAPSKYGHHLAGWGPLYTFLEYIDSTGTEYINTGFVPSADYKHTIVFQGLGDYGTDGQYLCGTGASYGRSGNVKIQGNVFLLVYIENKSGGPYLLSRSSVECLPNSQNTLVMDLHNSQNSYLYLNGTDISLSGMNDTTITSTNPLILFRLSVGSSEQKPIRIYSDTIEQNGDVIHYFVPARRNSDNAIGMYDNVSGTFYENAGTGAFIAGPEVQQ